MRYTIKSRKLNKTLTFYRDGPAHIYVDMNGQPGILGKKICYNGQFTGVCLSCEGEDQAAFEKLCKQWYQAHIA